MTSGMCQAWPLVHSPVCGLHLAGAGGMIRLRQHPVSSLGQPCPEECVVVGPQTVHLRLRLERKYVSSAPKKTIIDA